MCRYEYLTKLKTLNKKNSFLYMFIYFHKFYIQRAIYGRDHNSRTHNSLVSLLNNRFAIVKF